MVGMPDKGMRRLIKKIMDLISEENNCKWSVFSAAIFTLIAFLSCKDGYS